MNTHPGPDWSARGSDRRASWSIVTAVVAGTVLAAILHHQLKADAHLTR